MSSVVISGNTSGTITLAAPDVAGTTTLTLPAVSGTLITSGGGYAGSFTTLTSTQDATFATSSGNVGVGTATPTFTSGTGMQVKGSGDTNIRVSSGSSTGVDLIKINDGTSYLWNRDNASLLFGTNNAERLRIGTSGELGLSGANYGTSGQVLTSNGSGAAASWTTVSSSPTTAQVLSATAGLSAGAVGSYALATYNNNYGGAISFGSTESSSYINASSCSGSSTSAISGTWRCLGGAAKNVASAGGTTLWIRIS